MSEMLVGNARSYVGEERASPSEIILFHIILLIFVWVCFVSMMINSTKLIGIDILSF